MKLVKYEIENNLKKIYFYSYQMLHFNTYFILYFPIKARSHHLNNICLHCFIFRTNYSRHIFNKQF